MKNAKIGKSIISTECLQKMLSLADEPFKPMLMALLLKMVRNISRFQLQIIKVDFYSIGAIQSKFYDTRAAAYLMSFINILPRFQVI